ncbi:MAG: AAA family ATPase [Nitrospirae bacterium]|nr:AAA family ATPase [Nitrospirota bacterium]
MTVQNLKSYITKVNIENFKCFEGLFSLELSKGLNILVGDNESGKSTILEAIHLALTGMFNGRYLKNELTHYLFNKKVVDKYLSDLKAAGVGASAPIPPSISIEVFIAGDDIPSLEGNWNSEKTKALGITLIIAFDKKYQTAYEALVKNGDVNTLPIEYYDVSWKSFSDDGLTPKTIPLKSALIDSSTHRYRNGSDVYISQIVKDFLDTEDVVAISQAHRKLKEGFMQELSIQGINAKIKDSASISNKEVKISVDLSSKNAWENTLMTYLDDIPFQHIGKGEQTIVKTKLSLGHKKSKEANILLLEEPENHLSHSKLNQLIREIKDGNRQKQVIISTHSSFVANKLGLENIILLHNLQTIRFNDLGPDTKNFFEKLAGYDTLRLLLCKKAILVEGDSDELVVQKAYRDKNSGHLPIEDGVDVLSVGTAFLRFLEIAQKLKKPAVVVIDNDGDVDVVKEKYKEYLSEAALTKDYIKICFDGKVEAGTLPSFNYNTLEPKMVGANGLQAMNDILGTKYGNLNELHVYMRNNKTVCALKVFDASQEIKYPAYILDAINANSDGKK